MILVFHEKGYNLKRQPVEVKFESQNQAENKVINNQPHFESKTNWTQLRVFFYLRATYGES